MLVVTKSCFDYNLLCPKLIDIGHIVNIEGLISLLAAKVPPNLLIYL